MLTLDEDEDASIDIEKLMVEQAPPQPRFRINLQPILVGLVILLLGGGLGTAAYFFAFLDVRDVIGALDVGDRAHLSMQMPGLGGAAAPPAEPAPAAPAAAPGGPLLSPPGGEAAKPADVPTAVVPPASADAPVAAPAPSPAVAEAPKPSPAAIPAQPSPPRDAKAGIPAYSALTLPQGAEVKPLAPVPVPMLFRETPEGPLPVVALDGRQPWKEYRRPFTPPPNRPVLGIVVTNLGLEREAVDAAITKLPPEVTLAFTPYAQGLDKMVKKAREAGHEVMLAVPTEPSGFPGRDPGPWGLLTSSNPEENVSRLEKMMVRMPGYVGVVADDGPFVRSAAHLAPVLAALKERGLMFAGRHGADDLPYAHVTEIADEDLFKDAIDARLMRAGLAAREQGHALVMVSATPVALDRLSQWIAKNTGITIAPASALVKEPRPEAKKS